MSKLEIEQILVLRDNYIHLLHDPDTGATAAVDPAEAQPVLERLAARGWTLSHIFNTHHHDDHTGGNLQLKQATGCKVVGSSVDAQRIPGLDTEVTDRDSFTLGGIPVIVMAMPGHTLGHVAYWLPEARAVFCGDTLFSLGCGRLMGGTARQMWHSLSLLRGLPDETLVYCAHEYTQANGRFCRTVERDNPDLKARLAEVEQLRAGQRPTVPSILGVEKAANPFLRADFVPVKRAVGLPDDAEPARVFAELRRRKDVF